MRFLDAILSMVIIGIMFAVADQSYLAAWRLNERALQKKKCYDCAYFVTESFRNSCRGKGFASLNEWQKTCRAMWNLNYISWADASEFMTEVEKGVLFYGVWENENLKGEVYCRKQKF